MQILEDAAAGSGESGAGEIEMRPTHPLCEGGAGQASGKQERSYQSVKRNTQVALPLALTATEVVGTRPGMLPAPRLLQRNELPGWTTNPLLPTA